MTVFLRARSISRTLLRLTRVRELGATTLAVFDHACNLVTPDGWTLVYAETADGFGALTTP